MATGQLGKAARISYESKNRVSGLIDIQATIQRPDGIDLGPFTLTEYRPGFYKYDFITALSDLEGDYLGFIESPTEGHTAHFKLNLFKPGGGGGSVQIIGCEPLIGKVAKTRLIGIIKSVNTLFGNVADNKIVGKTKEIETLKGSVKDINIKGIANKDC